jgi:transposase-like protein
VPDRRYRRDTKKKRFVETLAAQGTVSHAAQTAGVSRNTVYRWRDEDREFAASWDVAHETAVDAVESSLYQKALNGDTICMIFYLKAHRPIYRDKLNIDVKQVQSEIEERLAQLRENPELLARVIPRLTE